LRLTNGQGQAEEIAERQHDRGRFDRSTRSCAVEAECPSMRCPVAVQDATFRRYTFPNAVLIPAGVSRGRQDLSRARASQGQISRAGIARWMHLLFHRRFLYTPPPQQR
jgi:hypothetical protein